MLVDSHSTCSNLCAALPVAFLQSWRRFPVPILLQNAVLNLPMHLHRHLDGFNIHRRCINRTAASWWQESDYYPFHFICAPATVRFYCKHTLGSLHSGTFRDVLLYWIFRWHFRAFYRLHQCARFTRCRAWLDFSRSVFNRSHSTCFKGYQETGSILTDITILLSLWTTYLSEMCSAERVT